jgi:hypothetical protein
MYEKKLQASFDNHRQLVNQIAAVAFEQVIKPFCIARGFRFIAGNGDWSIGPPDEESWYAWDHKDDTEWQEIAAILNLEVPGMPANDLGSLMPEYRP